ncbi:HelD family protein [Faecalimonas sp.]
MEKLDGAIFLKEITEKLDVRIRKLEDGIEKGQKEIEDMHTYYWENYTEMDEYGYENYDNQQALFRQVDANQEKLQLKYRFEKMKESPFFARVDFQYEDEEDAENFYIGIGNFAESTGETPLIYDWRAPVSSLFYDYDKGNACYQAPAGVLEGEILAKWQYKIKSGEMVYGFESDMKIDDDILKQELGSNGDVQLKNIVRTIQKEQNEIIRNTSDKILVIQGVAGSGKTSVALHRIAYLLYHDRKKLRSTNVLILSPNGVFADYISHILPELNEENIQEMSFDLFAYKELRHIVSDCEDRYHQIERQLCENDKAQEERYKIKQSAQFVGFVEGFLTQLEDELMDFTEVEFKGMKFSEQEIIDLFYNKFQDIPILSRMNEVMEYFIDAWETLRGGDLSEEEKEYFSTKFTKMYVTRDIYIIYNWLLQEMEYPLLPEVSYEKRKLEYEDVFPMLYLKYRLEGGKKHKQIKHLVIDEMQDYSYLQYVILSYLFSCRMTILGDKAQTIDTTERDVMTFLFKILGKDLRKIVMNKSYRNTVEIARYANAISGNTDMQLFDRHGKEVEEKIVTEKEVIHFVANKISEIKEKYETIAIITLTEKEAWQFYQAFIEKGMQASYLDRDSMRFEKNVIVTTFYMAKGLEFDCVFGISSSWNEEKGKQGKYICATRALHELYMLEVKNV